MTPGTRTVLVLSLSLWLTGPRHWGWALGCHWCCRCRCERLTGSRDGGWARRRGSDAASRHLPPASRPATQWPTKAATNLVTKAATTTKKATTIHKCSPYWLDEHLARKGKVKNSSLIGRGRFEQGGLNIRWQVKKLNWRWSRSPAHDFELTVFSVCEG